MENIYKKMKGLLGMTEELSDETNMMAEAYLVDGTTIKTESDRFEEGSMVFVVGEDDERMALPSGTYELQDGAVIEVVDGEITTLRSPEASEDAVEEDMTSVEEEKVETPEIDLSTYMTKEDGFELGKMITEAIDLKIADLISAHNTELEKVNKLSAAKTFKNTPKAKKFVEMKKSDGVESRVFAIFNKSKNK
tara:strand:+ start:11662 stop:12240 length:579 start_codon:yes stop_codon:yes gene_type:complete